MQHVDLQPHVFFLKPFSVDIALNLDSTIQVKRNNYLRRIRSSELRVVHKQILRTNNFTHQRPRYLISLI
ncbi:hypothetical protein Hdeb2414_s0007g00234261 [Helianthus debilis subsp. tardiflorus]